MFIGTKSPTISNKIMTTYDLNIDAEKYKTIITKLTPNVKKRLYKSKVKPWL